MISGNSGYKIARSWEEARETVSRLESQAKKMLSRVRKTRDFFSEAARADMEADRERRKYNPAQLEIFAGAVNV
jgi:transcriptional regulator